MRSYFSKGGLFYSPVSSLSTNAIIELLANCDDETLMRFLSFSRTIRIHGVRFEYPVLHLIIKVNEFKEFLNYVINISERVCDAQIIDTDKNLIYIAIHTV